MWYYESNQQPFGPVSKETVAEALKEGKINESTLVWREGMSEWKRLAETELAVLVGGTLPAVIENIPTVYAPATTNLPHSTKIQSESLNKLFWWWFGLLLASIPYYVLTYVFSNQPWLVTITCILYGPLLAGMILQYILTYRFWQIIQDGFQQTTPGKAVGFLFIPIFNLYWNFVAFFGLSKDMNRYVDRHFSNIPAQTVRKASPVLSLCYGIVMCIQMIYSYYNYSRFLSITLNALGDTSLLSNSQNLIDLPTMIITIVHLILMIAAFFDYFQTAKSILAAEEKLS